MKINKRIVLVGPTASGKSFIKNCFNNRGFKVDISYTSRSIRTGEVDGIDYYFVSKEDFINGIKRNIFFEYVQYDNNYYGTERCGWENSDVFIMETDGIKHITDQDRINTLIIYVNTPIEIRKQRMKERGWNDEKIEKRLKQDEIKFKDFKNYDLEISSMTFYS